MRSIHRQLLLTLLLTLVGAFSLSGLLSYFTTAHEVDELFDAQLIENARVLKGVLNQPGDKVNWGQMQDALAETTHEHPASGDAMASGHAYEKKIAIQVWSADGSNLLLRSPSAPERALAPLRHGFYAQRSGAHLWHVYTSALPANGYWLLVAERSDIRDEVTLNIAASLLIGGIAGLVLATWRVRRSLRRELAPLRKLHDAIAERGPEHLGAIALEAPPEELQPVVSALNHLLGRVNDGIERERRFLADAAHELRTPLAVLRLQAENAIAADATPTQRLHLERLITGVDRSTRVVEQLLLLARLDANAVPFVPRTVAVDEIARDIIASLAPLAHARQQDIGLSQLASQCHIAGEPVLLGALLRNLVENALRHTPEGGSIDVQLQSVGEQLRLSVSDSGPGVAPDVLERLTCRFVRDSQHDTGGSGLGLSIASHIAALHGSALHLANREPHGLCVSLDLPLLPTG
ncbi:MAG: ATP-binding protein [Moraxellaceae bacterium]|nr:ATP-binding protein [Moraxellaceae bacterium]